MNQPGDRIPAADVPKEIPYGGSTEQQATPEGILAIGAVSGTFTSRMENGKQVSTYDHYSDDGKTVCNGTETFVRDQGGCTFEAHLTAEGEESGHMDLRFVQPQMWSAAKADFSVAEDGKPASCGGAAWRDQMLYVRDMQ